MSLNIKWISDTVRQLAFGSIDPVVYMGIGTEFDYPVWTLRVENLTNGRMMFSFNGIDDHFPLLVHGYISLDIVANADTEQALFGLSSQTLSAQTLSAQTLSAQNLYLKKGDRLYVRHIGVAPTMGAVYVSTSHGN